MRALVLIVLTILIIQMITPQVEQALAFILVKAQKVFTINQMSQTLFYKSLPAMQDTILQVLDNQLVIFALLASIKALVLKALALSAQLEAIAQVRAKASVIFATQVHIKALLLKVHVFSVKQVSIHLCLDSQVALTALWEAFPQQGNQLV